MGRINKPCPHCGREDNGKWLQPCPSDDCPSHDKPKMKKYLLRIHSDVEAEIIGPFRSDKARIEAVKAIKREVGDEDGTFRLNAEGAVTVEDFGSCEVSIDDEGVDICSNCGAVGEAGTMKDVDEADFDLLCGKCLKRRRS